jgi:hypothetical protein
MQKFSSHTVGCVGHVARDVHTLPCYTAHMSHAGVSEDGACVRDCESYTVWDLEIACVHGEKGSGVLLRNYGGWTRYRLWERYDDVISTSQYVVMLGFGVTSHFFRREVVLEMGARGDEFNDKQIRLPDPSQNRSNHSTFKFLTKPYTFTMLQSITQATMHHPISHTTPFFYPTNTLLPTIYTNTQVTTTCISTPLA